MLCPDHVWGYPPLIDDDLEPLSQHSASESVSFSRLAQMVSSAESAAQFRLLFGWIAGGNVRKMTERDSFVQVHFELPSDVVRLSAHSMPTLIHSTDVKKRPECFSNLARVRSSSTKTVKKDNLGSKAFPFQKVQSYSSVDGMASPLTPVHVRLLLDDLGWNRFRDIPESSALTQA